MGLSVIAATSLYPEWFQSSLEAQGAGGFTDIRVLQAHQRKLIVDNYDDFNLVTGREGRWKSLWMRKRAKAVDPAFTVKDIHFQVEDLFERIDKLRDDQGKLASKGRVQVLDEFKGHRRLAMTGERTDFLDWTKEARGMGLHLFIGYNRFTRFERDLVTDRIAFWHHARRRGLMEVRQPGTELSFDRDGEPIEPTRYPLVGRYTFTGANDPFRWQYEAKKEARMMERTASFLEDDAKPTVNLDAFREAVQRLGKPQVNPAMLNEVQKELAKSP